MKRGREGIRWGAALTVAGMAAAAVWFMVQAMPISTGYVAKYLCTSVFLSGRDPATVFLEEVRPVNPLTSLVAWDVDRRNRVSTATALGRFTAEAVYREGCGCTLATATTAAELRNQQFYQLSDGYSPPLEPPEWPWPRGRGEAADPASLGVDPRKLQRALDNAFTEPGPDRRRQTGTVAVVFDGRLIAERYGAGFGRDTPILGWSMSKSVVNALVGILVGEGRLALHAPAPVPEWQSPSDPRGRITLDQLMRMSSGLAFEETYRPLADVTEMLYGSYDFAAFAAARPLRAEPDARWVYSSGSANIVARIVRHALEKKDRRYYRFIRERLFDRIGMTSVVMEADPSGTVVGSSYTVATLRDWARFGLLYLQDGVWNGERVLPPGWVKYTTTPTPKASKGQYGALF